MLTELPPPLVLLLHEGGWDEVLMVAIGLAVAYGIIVWTGRRSQVEDEESDEETAEGDPPETTRHQGSERNL